jgi:hypothetical protein
LISVGRKSVESFEKLGVFYLGRVGDPQVDPDGRELLLYDSKDLTTHAICVGMTGSGKTGLCLSLLEEAALDGIPAIAIDPKGDLGNLLLTFPRLDPSDFRPWVDEGEASRQGISPDELATRTATMWKEGLSRWGEDGGRIERMRAAADFAIYTPGSTAGLPLSLLQSFNPPPAGSADGDALRERIAATVAGLLALLGIDADPVKSRETILLSALLQQAWNAGAGLDLPSLIRQVQSPPFDRIGISSPSIPRRSASPSPWRSTTCSPHRASHPGWKGSPSTWRGSFGPGKASPASASSPSPTFPTPSGCFS